MKKGVVALLVIAALVVLISPAIVGRLAERSMDENLDWAAQENSDIVISSQGFDRGWFSSEGRHRIDVRDGQIADILLELTSAEAGDALPALIIDTRLDHGLIPVASMTRENGTLAPGLGSAVSTVSIDVGDGDAEIFALPGKIYSKVGLAGELTSNYVLEPGTHRADEIDASWGNVNVTVTTNPVTGDVDFEGLIDSLNVAGGEDSLRIGALRFTGRQTPSRFGFNVGDIEFDVDHLTLGRELVGNATSFGPLSMRSSSSVDGDRVSGQAKLGLAGLTAPMMGDMSIDVDVTLNDVDGDALGAITRKLDSLDPNLDPDELLGTISGDLERLLAGGLELRFDRFDVSLPQGPVTSQMHFVVTASDPGDFSWTALLLALEASANLRIPAELVDLIVATNPQANAAIAMGILRKNDDFYTTEAAYKKGLLTVNGAPMPIPLPSAQM